jgi:hypothetical protein
LLPGGIIGLETVAGEVEGAVTWISNDDWMGPKNRDLMGFRWYVSINFRDFMGFRWI